MRVDEAIRRVFRVEAIEAQRQRDVLHDVSEVSGVKGVAVIHASIKTRFSMCNLHSAANRSQLR
jgi:hypothetical protein